MLQVRLGTFYISVSRHTQCTVFKLKNLTSTVGKNLSSKLIEQAQRTHSIAFHLINAKVNCCRSDDEVESSKEYVEAYGEILFLKIYYFQNN